MGSARLAKLMGRADETAEAQLLGALREMLGRGGGGLLLNGLLHQMRSAGLESQVVSWLGDGENLPITASDVRRSVHPLTLSAVAGAAGLSRRQAADGLARLMPRVADRLSVGGRLLWGQELEDRLEQLGSGHQPGPAGAQGDT